MSKSKSKISAPGDKVETINSKTKRLRENSDFFYTTPFFKNYWPAVFLIIGLSFALYHTCLPFGYVLDDIMVISENNFTKKGFGGIKEIMTTESFTGYFGERKELVQGNRYRPFSIITFAVEYGILGEMNPWISHFINIILYAITGIFLMMVLQMLFRHIPSKSIWFSIPFLAAILYIVHPIHTEAVANIKGRDEILSMLFSLLALYGSIRYMDYRSKGWLSLSLISYFLALLSKENAITFLAVIPLTIYFFNKQNLSRTGWLVGSLFITTIAYLILRFNTAGVPQFGQQINDLMNNPFLGMKASEKFGSIMYTLGKYIALMVWPHPLSHDYYPYAIPKISIFSLWPMISLILYMGLIVIAFRGLLRKTTYSFSIFYYLITLTIVSNIVINLGTFMNERFIFMASAGFCIATAYFLSQHLPVMTKYGKYLSIGLALIAIAGYSAKTYVRVPVWKDALSLNEAAVAVSSNSARANSFMATALFEKFRTVEDQAQKKEILDKVEFYATKAINLVPDYYNANLMMVGVASERYKLDFNINNYITMMKPVILRRPDIKFIKEFGEYLKGKDHNAELFPFYLDLGNTLVQHKDSRRDWALQYLTFAYDINPGNKQVNLLLSRAYELTGNAGQADRYKVAAESLQ